MMTVYETVGKNQKSVLTALHHSNEALLEMMKPLFTTSEPLLKVTNELPMADQVATPKEVVEQWFGFLEEVLKEEKSFLLNVAGLFPRTPAKARSAKTAPKPRSAKTAPKRRSVRTAPRARAVTVAHTAA